MAKCLICNKEIDETYSLCKNCYMDVNLIDLTSTNNRKIKKKYKQILNKTHQNSINDDLNTELKFLCSYAKMLGYMENRFKYNNEVIDKIEKIKSNNTIDSIDLDLEQEYKDFRLNNPKEYRCKDSHYVRSLGEVTLANWLYEHKIRYKYEEMIQLKNNKKLYPDFYLEDYDVYIEVFGYYKKGNYTKIKEYKKNQYKINKLKVYEINPDNLKNIDDVLNIIMKEIRHLKKTSFFKSVIETAFLNIDGSLNIKKTCISIGLLLLAIVIASGIGLIP